MCLAEVAIRSASDARSRSRPSVTATVKQDRTRLTFTALVAADRAGHQVQLRDKSTLTPDPSPGGRGESDGMITRASCDNSRADRGDEGQWRPGFCAPRPTERARAAAEIDAGRTGAVGSTTRAATGCEVQAAAAARTVHRRLLLRGGEARGGGGRRSSLPAPAAGHRTRPDAAIGRAARSALHQR